MKPRSAIEVPRKCSGNGLPRATALSPLCLFKSLRSMIHTSMTASSVLRGLSLPLSITVQELTETSYVTTDCDITRLSSPGKVASWFGLTHLLKEADFTLAWYDSTVGLYDSSPKPPYICFSFVLSFLASYVKVNWEDNGLPARDVMYFYI